MKKIIFTELTETDFTLNKFNDLYGFLSPDAISNGTRTMDICHMNKLTTKDELLSLIGPKKIINAGINLFNKCVEKGYTITPEYCINHQYTLAICRAFNGYQKEVNLFNSFKNLGIDVRMANNQLDLQYAIDMTLHFEGLIVGIQLKPISYYYATDSHKSSIKEKNKLKNKRFIQKLKEKGIVGRTYIVYHKDNNFVINTPETILNDITAVLEHI